MSAEKLDPDEDPIAGLMVRGHQFETEALALIHTMMREAAVEFCKLALQRPEKFEEMLVASYPLMGTETGTAMFEVEARAEWARVRA